MPSSAAALQALAADVDQACRLQGNFVLRSGQIATEYFDKYLFESDPSLLGRVVEAMCELLPSDTELIGGLELGGIPIATRISARTNLPLVFIRKQAKEYGTRKLAEGAAVAGRVITLIEDVITTGGAVRDATMTLRSLGAEISTVCCAIDRSANDRDASNRSEIDQSESPPLLADIKVEIKALLTKDLLDAARANS